jgi:hypothetical protein
MAAGLGFKTFNTGDVLTASEVNGYLMQGILVFADATARDAAITSPQEGQFAFTKDNNSLWYYSGSAWVASGATGDIEGVTAGTGISGGGTSGTVTITNSIATAIDAKGDLIVGTGADTFDRLAVGTNGHTLVADSGETTGLKYVAGVSIALNAQTAAYTLVAGDAFKLVTVNDTVSRTVTIPPSVFTAGQIINVQRIGTGAVPFAAGSGVTITSTGASAAAPTLRAQYSAASIVCTASDTFTVLGDIA